MNSWPTASYATKKRVINMTTVPMSFNLKRLEQLYAAGLQVTFVDSALHKIVARQIERDEVDLTQIQHQLSEYEARYRIASEDFWRRFRAGQMDDTADFMEWNILCRSRERLLTRIRILRGESSDG